MKRIHTSKIVGLSLLAAFWLCGDIIALVTPASIVFATIQQVA